MSAWLDQTEEEQTMQIRRAVKQTKMPEVSYVNQIMERVENHGQTKQKVNPSQRRLGQKNGDQRIGGGRSRRRRVGHRVRIPGHGRTR
ncbi:hypothetical protein VQ056_02935 [Paenibacillus sp. JTLBN-2024]